MFIIFYLVFILALSVNMADEDKNYVFMGVYYESLDPQSRYFITEQLKPAIELLNDYIDVDFIPFGKARESNGTSFHCRRGKPECMSNVIQTCSLHFMRNRADIRQLVDYVACELTTQAGSRNDTQCVRQAGVNLGSVTHCIFSHVGKDLQIINESKTSKLKPQNIPTITFDGVYDKYIQELSLINLIRAVCSYFNYSVKPCKRRLKVNAKYIKHRLQEDVNAGLEKIKNNFIDHFIEHS